jgi:hypothetical protein
VLYRVGSSAEESISLVVCRGGLCLLRLIRQSESGRVSVLSPVGGSDEPFEEVSEEEKQVAAAEWARNPRRLEQVSQIPPEAFPRVE